MFYILGLLIVAFLLSMIPVGGKSKKQIKQEIINQNKAQEEIKKYVSTSNKQFINQDFTKGIVLGEESKMVHVFIFSRGYHKSYNYDDIIQSEVIIDQSIVTTINRGKQVISATVGNMIAGLPGMIIGGLSSGTTNNEHIKNIDLKLTFKDKDDPIFKINFLSPPPIKSKNGYERESLQVRNSLNYIERWQGYFSVILKQQNEVV